MPARSRLLTNAAANYAGQVVTVAVTLLLTPAILTALGDTMFGVLMLVSSFQGLGALFDFGITTSVVKYVAEHHAREETDEINRVVSSSFFMYLLLGLLAFSAMSAVAVFGLPYFNVQGELLETARGALLLAGVSLLIGLPMSVFGSVLLGLRKYEIANVVNIVQALAAAGVTLLVLRAGGGPVELMAVNTVSLASGHAARAILALRALPGLGLRVGYANRGTLRRIGGYSVWLFLLETARRIFYNADAVLIAAFLPVARVTAYNLGFKPASALTYLSGPFVSVFLPAASAMDARNSSAELQRLLVSGTRLALVVTLPAALWLLTFGRQIMQVWVGPGHEDALPILYAFVAVFLVSTAQNPASVILRGIGKVRSLALVVVAEYAANIALTLLLLPRIGVMGAAIGTLIPAVVNDLFVIPRLVCTAMQISYRQLITSAFLGPLAAAIPAGLVLWLAGRLLEDASLLTIAAGALLSVSVFGLCFLLLGANKEEKAWVGQGAGALRRRLNPTV